MCTYLLIFTAYFVANIGSYFLLKVNILLKQALSNERYCELILNFIPPFQTSNMGRIFLRHIGGTRLFSCASCDTPLTNRAELISTRFTGDNPYQYCLTPYGFPILSKSIFFSSYKTPNVHYLIIFNTS